MNTLSDKIGKLTSLITKLILLVTPIFFLPVTREFIIISKLYFFVYAVVLLMILSTVYLIASRKIVWHRDIMINGLLLFIIASALSIVIMSPNKVQALFMPQFGFIGFLAMVIYYMYLLVSARKNSISIFFYTGVAGLITAIVSIVAFIDPFKNVELPANIAFLQNRFFNLVGSQVDLVLFLGFALTGLIVYFSNIRDAHLEHGKVKKAPAYLYVFMAIIIGALAVQLFAIFNAIFISKEGFLLPPFSVSWYAAIEVLKNPFTALFGVGVGNYAAIFTQVKNAAYNFTDLWQISSFNVSRSALLHIITEMGLIGAAGMGMVIYTIFKHAKDVKNGGMVVMGYALAVLALFPPSFITFFIFFVALAYFTLNLPKQADIEYVVELGKIIPVFIVTLVLFLIFIGGMTAFTTVSLTSEILFKQGLDAVAKNDLQKLYEYQRNAIIINSSNEDFRRSFSQTNLIIANNIASKEQDKITDQDRETITQAIQASIAEAKAAVALNPQKVSNWQYLASVYRNIINVAQGAELWTIAAYQRAILLDPQNPVYRLELGGVYYLLQSYADAQRLFEQAATLKPDWANAHYNLAWAMYQQEDYANAAAQMEQVLTLITDKNAADYKQAQKDLETFKAKVPEQTAEGTPSATPTPGSQTQVGSDLELPASPAAILDEKLELPEDASPEANVTPAVRN